MNETGNFRESIKEDVKGLSNLYQASFLGVKGETIIDQAMEKNKMPKRLAMKLDHALNMPLHWGPIRLMARWFIDVYEEEPDMSPILLTMAKLDFNIVQSIHMKEIGKLVRYTICIS